jgi:hypothetical protein
MCRCEARHAGTVTEVHITLRVAGVITEDPWPRPSSKKRVLNNLSRKNKKGVRESGAASICTHGMRTSPHFYVCLAFVCRIYFCEPYIFDLHTVVRCVATEDPAAGVSLCGALLRCFFVGSHAISWGLPEQHGFPVDPDAYCITDSVIQYASGHLFRWVHRKPGTECLTSPGWRYMLEWQIMPIQHSLPLKHISPA